MSDKCKMFFLTAGDELDELYKKLQPAPSPQQFNYLNQFDGQELTITKQLNLAYQEQPTSSPSQPTSTATGDQLNPAPSPMSSQAGTTGPLSSAPSPMPPASTTPGIKTSCTTTSTSGNAPVTSTAAGINTSAPSTVQSQGGGARLTHYDPPANSSAPSSKNSMSNITSASLANLAKGVEHLSNQMQQNMMQGGPFHNIQIQGQMSDVDGNTGQGNGPPTPTGGMPQPGTPQPPHSQNQNQPPSVNNTFVNANLSIQQLNIQSVNQPGGPGNPSMQIQQMNSDMSMGGPGPGNMPPNSVMTSMSQQQSQHSMMFNGPSGPMPNDPMSQPKMDPMGNFGPGGGMPSRFPCQSPQFPGGPPPASGPSPGIPSPNYRQGNANVQIQAKAPNTIQYLPANPPSSQAGPMPPRKEFGDILPQFPSPLSHMDGNMPPTSKGMIGPGPGMNGPQDMMGPMGPGGPIDRMGPGPMGPGPGPSGPPMSMQQGGMMIQRSGQMSSMQYNPGMMHPGQGGPSPLGGMGSPPEMMHSSMQMQSQQMSMQTRGPMPGPPPHGGMPQDPSMMPPGPGGSQYSANYQQFQQQIYAQRGGGGPHPRGPGPGGMGPGPMMGGPGGPGGMGPGPGPMMGPGGGPPGPNMGPGGMMGPGGNMGGMPPNSGPYNMNMMPNMP